MSVYNFQGFMVGSVLYISRFWLCCVWWVILSAICMFNTGMGRQARLLNLYIVCTARIHHYFLIVAKMYCFVKNSTSSANLLVGQLSNYHQCDKTEQFHRFRRKLPLTLETFTQSLKRNINECQSITRCTICYAI